MTSQLKKLFFAIFLLLPTLLLYGEETPFSFFTPPQGWLISNPSQFNQVTKIGFVQSERKVFTPAMSLSVEKIPCDEKTYLEAVKKNHRSDMTKSIRELGLLKTQSGNARLFQIDTKNSWGKIRILQAILVKDGYAFIETATCLREDFLKIHQDILNSFKTLLIKPDLASTAKNKDELEQRLSILTTSWKKYVSSAKGEKEELFKGPFFQKNQWEPFTEYITNHYSDYGICWQALAIQYVKEKLMNL